MKKSRCVSFIMSVVIIFSFLLVPLESPACTGIQIETKDGNYIFARTLEFGAAFMPFDMIFVPRNHEYTGQTPESKLGMTWKTKYAHVGFNPVGESTVGDGLNEKGLACGSFYIPGYITYQNAKEDDYSRTISCVELTSWILSTCSTVAEVREQLPTIIVCGVEIPSLGSIPPLHFFVADATGDAIIIEYVAGGKLNIHDNEVNVITNSPNYPWHTTNQKNYIGLKALNNPPLTINGNKFAQLGQGSGAIGLPGDFTPPSRFVRAAFFARTAYQGKDVDEGIGIAFHILNQFDIPKGSIQGVESGKTVADTTQWTSAADLTNRRYFFHTYHDRTVRVLDFKDLDLDAPGIKINKDIQKPGQIINFADQLK